MSSDEIHWCYACNEPLILERGHSICPYCYEGFIQELNNHIQEQDFLFQETIPHHHNHHRNHNHNHDHDHNHVRVDSGDYFEGPGLEELIEQLSIDDQSGGGPDPATSSSINAMPTIKITRSHLRSDFECPICQEKFVIGSEAKAMPCSHFFHSDCIVPWLAQHNSCPVCRVELPPS